MSMYPATLPSIIFTLITTLWCCIRPDFPSPHDSKLRILLTKLNITVWICICPEAMVFWAMRQWFEAGKIAKEFQYRGWTRRHSLFLLMGGFILCNRDGKPIKTLSSGHFTRLLNQNVIAFPPLTSLEIQERSNCHFSISLIALLQAIWFLMHCLSHFINTTALTLPAITQLEAITATIEISCFFIFIFAWEKPLDGRSPVLIIPRVNLRDPAHFPSVNQIFELEQKRSQINQHRFQLECPQTRSVSITKFITRHRPKTCRLSSILLWLPQSVFNDIVQLVPGGSTTVFPDDTLKIPLFYVPDTTYQPILFLPIAALSLGISAVGMLFVVPLGGSPPYHFSSEQARVTWQIASMTAISFSGSVLCLTTLIVSFHGLGQLLGPPYWQPTGILFQLRQFCVGIVILTIFIGLIPFLLARLVLFVASVVYLGSTPGEPLLGRSWADYIPHFP